MRVLVLGGSGMLGHKLYQVLSARCDTYATTRELFTAYASYGIFNQNRLVSGVDVVRFDTVVRAMARVRPDVVVNCIGIVKQLAAAKDPIVSITINSLFPHRAADLCAAIGARFIHISTDCVFSGRKGNYTEDDVPDPDDLYGRSKLLGEVNREGCLTIRTSMIGRELKRQAGLLEWFLSQEGRTVQGYTNAIFSGFTTQALSTIIADIIVGHPQLCGLYHVSAEPISKYDLLVKLRDAFALDVGIESYEAVKVDRSLDSTRFWKATGFVPPDWDAMIDDLAKDETNYEAS